MQHLNAALQQKQHEALPTRLITDASPPNTPKSSSRGLTYTGHCFYAQFVSDGTCTRYVLLWFTAGSFVQSFVKIGQDVTNRLA